MVYICSNPNCNSEEFEQEGEEYGRCSFTAHFSRRINPEGDSIDGNHWDDTDYVDYDTDTEDIDRTICILCGEEAVWTEDDDIDNVYNNHLNHQKNKKTRAVRDSLYKR